MQGATIIVSLEWILESGKKRKIANWDRGKVSVDVGFERLMVICSRKD